MTSLNRLFLSAVIISLLATCASGRGAESIESRVSRLVDQMTKSERSARDAVREMQSLGNQATPYLVGHLGDVRPIATRQITFDNLSEDSFEGVRHYGPHTVHDALAAILNAITGESFLFVYNGATAREREENRRNWIDWCRSKYPAQAQACSGK